MKYVYLILLSIIINCTQSFAQDCGCDYVVGLDVDEVDGGGFAPGDVICIVSGTRLQLQFENISGTAENPVVIKNCGGEVLINAPFSDHGIRFSNCSHVKLTGTGDEDFSHGIRIINNSNSGINFTNLSNFWSLDHIKIANVNGWGIRVREEPKCDLTTNEGYFLMENCRVQNVEISGCKKGISLGHPLFHVGLVSEECGPLFPYGIKDIEISNTTVENTTGGDGVALYGATGKIENCVLKDIAGNGIRTGTMSAIDIDQNTINNTYLAGIMAEGSSQHHIRNNVFSNNSGVGVGSVWLEFYLPVGGGDDYNSLEFRHNTSVGSGSFNLTIEHPENASELCYIQNNLFAESLAMEPYLGDYDAWLNIEASADFLVENNVYSDNRNDFYFVDGGAGDFRLTHESPVINDGVDYGVVEDYLGQTRNLAGAPDLGAIEYVPEPIAYFKEIPLVGLYVNDFKYILGDEEAETQLLEFARDSGFNYLLFYNLDYIHYNIGNLDDPVESTLLANFIEKAKRQYGMVQIGAVGETNASFDKIEAFNSFNTNNWFRTFDVLNMEFEFWTENASLLTYYCDSYLTDAGLPCTNDGAFEYYKGQLEAIDTRADDMGIMSEIYLGYTSDPQSMALAERCDRILLHHYRTSDTYGDGTSIYNYHTYRIQAIALSERKPAVMPIFSSRSYHMGPWLEDHSLHQPMETWLYGIDGYYMDFSEGVHDLPISGFQWYRYTSFFDVYEGVTASETPTDESDLTMAYNETAFGPQLLITSEEEWEEGEYYCVVNDLHGRPVGQYLISDLSFTKLRLNGLQTGVYICQIVEGQELLGAKKIIVS